MCSELFNTCSRPLQADSDSCWLSKYCCTHPTQCGQAVCGTGAVALATYGCATNIATGNVAGAAIAATGAALAGANACAGIGGMACVSDRIKLSNNTARLEETARTLKDTSDAQAQEIARLTAQLSEASSAFAQLQKERDEIDCKRSAALKEISVRAQDLDRTQKELMSIQQQLEIFHAQQTEYRKAQEEAAAVLKAENNRLTQSVSGLTKQVRALGASKIETAKENARLQELLIQLQQQENVLQIKIDLLVREKTALQSLADDLDSHSRVLAEQIEKSTQQYEEMRVQLEDLQTRLRSLPPQVKIMDS